MVSVARTRFARNRWGRARLALVVALVAVSSVAAPASAVATVSPSDSGIELATAIRGSGVSVFATSSILTRPPLGAPSGVASGAIAGFGDAAYAVLSTGNAYDVPNPLELGSTNLSGGAPAGRGSTVRDATILRVDFTAGAAANCLKFDFKFFSKEVPAKVGSIYNDGFVAELDGSSWSTTDASEISAPGNMAYDPGWRLTSVNTTGPFMTAAAAAGTLFDSSLTTGDGNGGGAPVRTALKALTPGTGAHSLYLSIFDQVSYGGDSAVLIDNLRAETVANPSVDCAPPPPPSDGGGGGGGGGFSPGGGAPVAPPEGGATLTLATRVTGGTASPSTWTLRASGPTPIAGVSGSASVTGVEVTAGSYVLSESGGPATYTAGWSCAGATLSGRVVTIDPFAAVLCTLETSYVDPYLRTGTFVIADRVARVGATVTYWGASWPSRNAPSKGTRVAAFRGYASSVSTARPRAGATWRTTPGLTASPPRSLPKVIAVAVTSSVRRSGSSISGNVVRIALVRRGSTFGVGTVVALLPR